MSSPSPRASRPFSLTGRNRMRVQKLFVSSLDKPDGVVDDTPMNETLHSEAAVFTTADLPTIKRTPRDKGKAFRYTQGDGTVVTDRSTRLYTHASVYRRVRRAARYEPDTVEEGALIIFLHGRMDIAVKGASDANRICKTGAWERIPGVVTIEEVTNSAATSPEPLTTTEPSDKLSPKHPKTSKEDHRMPIAKAKPATKRAATRKPAAAKAKATPARKPAARKPAAKAAGTASNGRLTHADKLALVPEIVKKLKSGVTFAQIRQEYVSSGLRRALTEAGYDTKGNKVEVELISTQGGAKATSKRVAAKRAEGWAWYRIEVATGMSEVALKEMLAENGYADLAAGRVVNEPVDKPATKRAPAKKAAATKKVAPASKVKPAVKAKAKVAPAAAVKAKPRPRRVARPQ